LGELRPPRPDHRSALRRIHLPGLEWDETAWSSPRSPDDQIRRASPGFQAWDERRKTPVAVGGEWGISSPMSFRGNRNVAYSCKYNFAQRPRRLLPEMAARHASPSSRKDL
jgi:hypothetical protein